ncbi:MarR family transcriptional regulator [Xenorhabdus sp. DI]|nr:MULTISPECIES: MarR family transcriptional regulator [unclassified Xenorhabdus]MBD2785096.1 MarR family transcriptional regulator [Xenorhabdus sp. 3]MBD2787559.1 MarR family transcriptional regulator [Xenorhabdus sp. DI]MDC9580011.1 MarR family transcriptional regulator [Xenorhabdus sp. PR6a]
MKALIGVMNEELIRKRILAIAKGEYKPQPDEPKVWFTSMIALAQVLSENNIALLRMMDEQKPETIAELSGLSGRKPSNLSTTLKTLNRHGLVRLEKNGKNVKPIALFTDFEIKIEQDLTERIMKACSKGKKAA